MADTSAAENPDQHLPASPVVLMLDAELTIVGFSAELATLLPIREQDIGCPVDRFRNHFDTTELTRLVRECRRRQCACESELGIIDGHVHHCHVDAFSRAGDDDHVVVTFIRQSVASHGNLSFTPGRSAQNMTGPDSLNRVHVDRMASMHTLMGAIAHRIRQPLQSIATYAGVLRRRLDHATEPSTDLHRLAEEIGTQIRQADHNLEALVKWIDRPVIDRNRVEMNLCIKQALMLVEDHIEDTETLIRLDLADVPLPVHGSRLQLEQVLTHLVANATEAMSQCKTRQIVISSSQHDQVVDISISNNGPGLAPEQAEAIFEPFHTTRANRLGMGLAISRDVIQDHGGHLWLDPDDEDGASFLLRLPLSDNAGIRDKT